MAARSRRGLPSATFVAFALLICAVFSSVSLVHPPFFARLLGYPIGGTDTNACIRAAIEHAGGLSAWLRTPPTDCPAQPGDNETSEIFLTYAALVLTTALHYVFRANRHARRRAVRPVDPRRHARLHAEIQRLAGEHLPGRRVAFLIDLLDPGVNGMAFGRIGKRAVLLSRGLVQLFDSEVPQNQEAFRAVLRHELAHLRNRDLDITQITLGLCRCYLVIALIPQLLVSLLGLAVDWHRSAEVVVTADQVVFAAVILFARGAVLRSRELGADARAVDWSGGTAGLRGVLRSRSAPEPGVRARFARLTRTHPPAELRLRALENPALAVLPRFDIAFVLGFCLPMSWDPAVSYTAQAQNGGVRGWWPAGLLTLLLVVALMLTLLRADVAAAPADRPRYARPAFRGGFALGVLCGGLALPSLATDGIVLPGLRPAVEISSKLVLACVAWLFVLWCEYLADAWAPGIGAARAPLVRTTVLFVPLCLFVALVAPSVFALSWQDVLTEFLSPTLRVLPAPLMNVAWAQEELMDVFVAPAVALLLALGLFGLPRLGRRRQAPDAPGPTGGPRVRRYVLPLAWGAVWGIASAGAAEWVLAEATGPPGWAWFTYPRLAGFPPVVGVVAAIGVWASSLPGPHPIARAARWSAVLGTGVGLVTRRITHLTGDVSFMSACFGVEAAVLGTLLLTLAPYLPRPARVRRARPAPDGPV